MEVRFKENIASIYGGFTIGQVADIPDSAAKDYISAGYAEKAPAKRKAPAKKQAEVEDDS